MMILPPAIVAADMPHDVGAVENPRMFYAYTGTPKMLPTDYSKISFGASIPWATAYPLASPFAIRPAVRLPATPLALPTWFPMFDFFYKFLCNYQH